MPSLGLSLKADKKTGLGSNFISVLVPLGSSIVDSIVRSETKGYRFIGGGGITLNGASSYSGGSIIQGGTSVVCGSASALGSAKIVLNGANLTIGGSYGSFSVPISVSSGFINTIQDGFLTGSLVLNSQFSGSGYVSIIVPSNAAINIGGNNSAFSGTKSFSQNQIQRNPFVNFTSGAATSSLASYVFNTTGAGGVWFYANGTQYLGSLSGNAPLYSKGTTGLILNIGSNNNSSSFAGGIFDSTSKFSLTKSGSGKLSLSGASTFSGGTNINQGEVSIYNATALGAGQVSINSGGMLSLNGISIANAITVNAGGVLNLNGATLARAPTNNGGTINP